MAWPRHSELCLFSEADELSVSPAFGHNSFISILGWGLAYITIASSGPHKISREMSMALDTLFYVRRNRDRSLGVHLVSTDTRGKAPKEPLLPQGILLPLLFFLEESPHQHPLKKKKRLKLLVR